MCRWLFGVSSIICVLITHLFQFVVPDVVLYKGNCPVCLEVRAASVQTFCGGILPFLLGNVGCLTVWVIYIWFIVFLKIICTILYIS